MEKPVISTWGIGPSYRNRVKQNILEAMESGYENTMDYVVLTDYPDDFVEFAEQTGKIVAIVDINEARKDSPWSVDLEAIPKSATDQKSYGEEYTQIMADQKSFSYALHRFSLPTIAQLGYTKIVFMDADVKITYADIGTRLTEEEFWSEFDTPVNSMKGCVAEEVHFGEYDTTGASIPMHLTRAMGGSQSIGALQLGSAVLLQLYKKYQMMGNPIMLNMQITEGPFRFYHFDSPEKVYSYFSVWNDTMEEIFTNSFLLNYQRCGGYMMCDYMPVAIANVFHNIQVLNFPNTVYKRRIFYEDRYFIPPMAAGMSTAFEPGETIDDFFEKNRELVNKMVELKAWPHHEPY
jgi:hypothetical protein